MFNLNNRQKEIVSMLPGREMGAVEILEELLKHNVDASISTVKRDLKILKENNLIEAIGAGKSIKYKLSDQFSLKSPVDIDKYFENRLNRYISFNDKIFDLIAKNDIFTDEENKELDDLSDRYVSKIKKLDQDILRREIERLTIDLSWKSSAIEGNTYDLLETETLIKQGIEAKGKPKEDAVMILNHTKAIKYIFDNSGVFKTLTIDSLVNLHSILVKDLSVKTGLRNSPVGITGTNYEPLSSRQKIREALSRAFEILNKKKNPFAKSLLALLLISYIQPFTDGNKRTSRLFSNAILLSGGLYPLSFRNVDITEYKKAVIIFYEINNLYNFKRMFIEQCKFAVEEYFHA